MERNQLWHIARVVAASCIGGSYYHVYWFYVSVGIFLLIIAQIANAISDDIWDLKRMLEKARDS